MSPKTKIVSNYKIDIPNYEEFNISKFINKKYSNCIILLDEGYVYLDSRLSMSQKNLLISYVLFQSRKKNVEIFMSMQLRSTIDIRFRSLTDFHVIAELKTDGFKYTLFNPNCLNEWTTSYLTFEKALPFMQIYDTNEVIEDTTHPVLFLTQKERYALVKELSGTIREDFSEWYTTKTKRKVVPKTSKPFIKKWLMEHEKPMDIASMIFDYCAATF